MSPDRFQVTNPSAVTEEYLRLTDEARTRGILPQVLRATKWIMEELARTPLEFGESREDLPGMRLHVRIAFVGPLAVQFAVHFDQPIVFIRGFRLRKRWP